MPSLPASGWQGAPGPLGVSPACWRRSCIFKGSRSGLRLPADSVGILFYFCFASSVTKSLSGDRPVSLWRGEALLGGRKLGVCGASQQKGRPAGALGTPRSLCELTQPRLPGHGAWASVGTVPAQPCPVPWAGLGSNLVGELPGPFGLGSWPSLSLPFILGPSTGNLLSLILELIPTCQGLCLACEGS